MRVVVDYDVDRLQVYNGDIKPSSTNCPRSFSKRLLTAIRDSIAELRPLSKEDFFELLRSRAFTSIVNPLELG